jgi:hypothetical protein
MTCGNSLDQARKREEINALLNRVEETPNIWQRDHGPLASVRDAGVERKVVRPSCLVDFQKKPQKASILKFLLNALSP